MSRGLYSRRGGIAPPRIPIYGGRSIPLGEMIALGEKILKNFSREQEHGYKICFWDNIIRRMIGKSDVPVVVTRLWIAFLFLDWRAKSVLNRFFDIGYNDAKVIDIPGNEVVEYFVNKLALYYNAIHYALLHDESDEKTSCPLLKDLDQLLVVMTPRSCPLLKDLDQLLVVMTPRSCPLLLEMPFLLKSLEELRQKRLLFEAMAPSSHSYFFDGQPKEAFILRWVELIECQANTHSARGNENEKPLPHKWLWTEGSKLHADPIVKELLIAEWQRKKLASCDAPSELLQRFVMIPPYRITILYNLCILEKTFSSVSRMLNATEAVITATVDEIITALN